MGNVRRAPAIAKRISEINESDLRVRVLGTVVEEGSGFIVLEDSSGKIKVKSEETGIEGSLVRVLGTPSLVENSVTLNAEVIQDMSGLDEKIYKKLELS